MKLKFRFIDEVDIQIHYQDKILGNFSYTSIPGFYKGDYKTNLWEGLIYIALRGYIEKQKLEKYSKDAPRKFINRLNNALETAFFKEEGCRPIKQQILNNKKYYVPRFKVINPQKS